MVPVAAGKAMAATLKVAISEELTALEGKSSAELRETRARRFLSIGNGG